MRWAGVGFMNILKGWMRFGRFGGIEFVHRDRKKKKKRERNAIDLH